VKDKNRKRKLRKSTSHNKNFEVLARGIRLRKHLIYMRENNIKRATITDEARGEIRDRLW